MIYKTNSLCIGVASNAWHLVLVNNLFIATEVDKNLAAYKITSGSELVHLL